MRVSLRNRIAALALATLVPATALAGRGSSPGAIDRAIRSGSADAIASELERAENLVCASCVKSIRPLIDHEDAKVRQVAAWWLARHMRSELFVAMAERLAQPDSRLARNAAEALGELKMSKGLVPLGAAIENPVFDAEARAAMARAVGRIGDGEGAGILGKALRARDAAVRAAAAAAFRDLRGFRDPSPAVDLLDDADEAVRIEAIYTIGYARSGALAGERGQAAAEKLAALVTNDASPLVRKKAAWALGEIAAPAAIAGPALRRAAAEDADARVRSLANAALGRLSP